MNNKVEEKNDFKKLKMLYMMRNNIMNISDNVGRRLSDGAHVINYTGKVLKTDRQYERRIIEEQIIELENKIVEKY